MLRACTMLLLLSGLLAAADQVVLKNGDTITGAIVKKDGGKLTIKSEFLGEVSMPWDAVKSVRSDETLTVQLPGGERVAGKVSTAGETLEVATVSGPTPVPMTAVGTIRNPAEQHAWERLQHPGMLELWTGFFDAGLTLARGNARTDTVTTSFNAVRVTHNDKIAVTVNQLFGTATINNVSSTVANAIRGNWTYNRDLTPGFFLSTLNSYEHDQFQLLNLRFVAGAGAGYNVIKKERTTLALSAGGDYEHEAFSQGLARSSAEANFGDELSHKFSGVTSVTQSFRYFANLSDTGQYRVNFDLGTVTAIRRWLGWHVTASDRFLSNPVFGRQRNDLLLTTGLRLSFAR
jgi:hypothetical protein